VDGKNRPAEFGVPQSGGFHCSHTILLYDRRLCGAQPAPEFHPLTFSGSSAFKVEITFSVKLKSFD
jgi:hypothetical protein